MNTITKIAWNNDKRNKTRSILIMAAICLTTMLLTIISTVGNGLARLQKEQATSEYGSNYGLFVAVNNTQLQEVKRRAEVNDIGLMCPAGILKGNEKGVFISVDEATRGMLPYNEEYLLTEGTYPEGTQDIAASKAFFKAQGYDGVKVGDSVTLNYRSGMKDEYSAQEFIVSGILHDRAEYPMEASYVVFCSSAFYEEQFAENERRYNVYFTLNDSAVSSMNNIESVMKNIAASCNIDHKNVVINDYYLMWVLEPSYEMIMFCGILIFGIVLFSVVVIYNIFQVGIAQKIREYGKIKALGTTKRQMKQLIFREGMLLAVPSIPIGLVLGFVIAKCSFVWLVEQGNSMATSVEAKIVPLFSLPMLLISVFVSLITLVMALQKPMKIVSRISPVEAARYLENSTLKNQGKRKGRKNVSVFSMAMANVTGSPKRTVGTVLTMGLSCVLFVIISNCVGNIDTVYEARRGVNHGQFELRIDYSMNDEAYPENNLDFILKNNPLNDTLIDEIKNIPGVTDVIMREIAIAEVNGLKQVVSIVNKEEFELMRSEGDIGSMNYEEAVKNGDVFFGWSMWMEEDGYSLEAPLSLQLDNGRNAFSYQGKIAGAFLTADTYWVMPKEVYQNVSKLASEDTSYGYLWIDCEEKDVPAVEQSLNRLIGNTSHMMMKTYHDELQYAKVSSLMMTRGCYLFMAIVGLIGFMNLANTMIINITTKKQEYGVLQAVGMTNKQLNQVLQIQGLLFTVGTIIVALVVGLPCGYMLFSYAKRNAYFGMNVYHIPIVPIMVMIVLICVLQIILSFLLSRNLKKETLVDRIRYQG